MIRKPIAAILSNMLCLGVMTGTAAEEPSHPVPKSPAWLTYHGSEGPGKGKHIVFITADQEYRSEQSLPMLAGILSKHHGFDCTVLFGVNEEGLVDPTMPVFPEKGKEDEFKPHHIPGLEYLEKADLLIFVTRLLTLPDEQLQHWVTYFDSGKPIIGLRTANHGFRSPLPYEMDGKRVNIGQILGGSFMNHHGNWQSDSTRGDIIPKMKDHPILAGVKDIWGTTDVYRTFKEGTGLPEGCTALVNGQPLIGREQGGADNPEKEPLPVVWVKNWTTSEGRKARVLQSTMGSAKDLQNPGLRRLIVNAAYWGLGLEDRIVADSSVEYTAEYKPLDSGFHYEKIGVIPRPPSFFAGSVQSEEKPDGAGEEDAAIKDMGKPWVVSDWSEWKLQETAPEGKVEVVPEVKESEPVAGRPPLSEAAKKAGVLVLGPGELLSIVKYEGKQALLLNDYEVSWEGMRLEGSDFFASLTFPVGSAEQCATFVTGGWGGWVTGISSLENLFANENETTSSTEFKQGRWYAFTLQVNKESLRAFIDGREIFHVGLKDRAISMHPSEIEKSMPLGFASYSTKGAIRNVRIRSLKPGELVAPE